MTSLSNYRIYDYSMNLSVNRLFSPVSLGLSALSGYVRAVELATGLVIN